MATLEERMETVLRVFRKECYRVLESERTTIRGADGMLMILQLVMAEINKQEIGDFNVALSDLVVAWKYLLGDKLQLHRSDAPCPENYHAIRGEYDSFMKRTNTVDLIDICRMYRQLRSESDPEEPLSAMELLRFLSGDVENCEDGDCIPCCPHSPYSKPGSCNSKVQVAVRRIFCSYLDLLVNSRNDLALACVLDVPARGLGQPAFSDLRREARSSSTSLFLAATSFVRAIQLGGKGYAPPESHPLRKHLKGLSDFVRFTDHLEELLGEIPEPSAAVGKLLSCVKAALLKGRSGGAAECEAVVRDLMERIARIHTAQREAACVTGISPAQPRAHAINHATAYGGRGTLKVLKALLDQEALAPPSRNKAELLSGDWAALEGDGETCLLSLFRSPEPPNGSSPKPLQQRVQEQVKPKGKVIRSQFACTYQEEQPPLNRVLQFPSASQNPTCVHPAPKPPAPPREVNSVEFKAGAVGEAQRGLVRTAALGSSCGNSRAALGPSGAASKRKRADACGSGLAKDERPRKRAPVGRASASDRPVGPTGASGKRKLIAGQGKLTGFFRL